MNAFQPCRGLGSRDRKFARRQFAGLLGVAVCALAIAVPALPAATFVHAPYLQNMGTDHVTIVWSARENQSATVQFSTDMSFSRTTAAFTRPFNPDKTGRTGMLGITFYQY